MKLILNVVFFQALWLSCVAGAGKGYAWIGLPVLLVFAIYHYFATPWKKADFALAAIALPMGVMCDTVMIQLGLLRFEQAVPSTQFAPVWIAMLWVGFALTINHSMAFFKTRFAAAVIFGAVGGPLAYWVAAKVWKAANFIAPDWQVYAALAVIWAIMTPLLLRLGSVLIDKFATKDSATA